MGGIYTPFTLARRKDRLKKDSIDTPHFSSIIKDDMLLLLSLMKRTGVKKILVLMASKPGLSIKELSASLKMRKETTCGHVRELLAKGVIVKDGRDRTSRYSINDEENKRIIRAIDFLFGEK